MHFMDNKLPGRLGILEGENNVNIVQHKTQTPNVSKNSYNIYQSIVMNTAGDNNGL